MKDTLGKILDVAVQKFGAEYVEVRAHKLFNIMLTIEEERVEEAKQ